MYDLRVEVAAIHGFCDMPHRVGDFFEVRSGRLHIPDGKYVCLWALSALLPVLPAKERKIAEANDWLPRVEYFSCPDPNGRVIWKITQVPQDGALPAETPAGTSIGRLAIQPRLCTECGACVAACPQSPSRVRLPGPVVCCQCGVAKCIPACSRGALTRGADGRVVLVDATRCDGCGDCLAACPYQAIEVVGGKAVLCDLCQQVGEDPRCVAACPAGALTLVRGI